MSQQLIDVSAVTHNDNAISEVQSVSYQERGQLVRLGPADNDTWPTMVVARNKGCAFSCRFADAAVAEGANIDVGEAGTFVAKGHDPGGTAANDVTVNIANAVIGSRDGNLVTQGPAGFSIGGEAYSADGTTSPLSFS